MTLENQDIIQKSKNKSIYIYLTSLFFIAALSAASEKLTIRGTLVQEEGIDIMIWGWIRLKMSQTVLINICMILFLMLKLILKKLKVY